MATKDEAGPSIPALNMTFPDTPPVHRLQRQAMESICAILDVDETWKQLLPFMRGVSMLDIEGADRHGQTGSPSRYLLRVWSTKGYTVLDLYNLLGMAKLVRCMTIMRNHVPEKYHKIEEYVKSMGTINSSIGKQMAYSSRLQQSSTSTPSRKASDGPGFHSASTAKNPSSSTSISQGTNDSLMSAFQNTLTVPYEELEAATNNFCSDNVLGKGGYGVVYRGTWKQLPVAIKRINASGNKTNQLEKERLRQSLQELRTLAKFRHDNILPLYAFSLEGPEPCLVYMYMVNGSLEDRLLCRKSTPPLTWPQKQHIAEGTARGLYYLHTTAKTPTIHGDVKTANILLDRLLEPKLGDFGLSREGQVEAGANEKSPLIASHIKGTLAYLPPEFITSKILSTKLDVFSYGIVLLELATGMRAYVESRNPQTLVNYILHNQSVVERSNGNVTMWMKENIMDKRTPSTETILTDMALFFHLVELGLKCANTDRNIRPSFDVITAKLGQICFNK